MKQRAWLDGRKGASGAERLSVGVMKMAWTVNFILVLHGELGFKRGTVVGNHFSCVVSSGPAFLAHFTSFPSSWVWERKRNMQP